jgi:vacuolar-type H+-ATPase subunit D/Vma8
MDGIRLTIIPRKDQPIKKIKLTREECEKINTYALKGVVAIYQQFK